MVIGTEAEAGSVVELSGDSGEVVVAELGVSCELSDLITPTRFGCELRRSNMADLFKIAGSFSSVECRRWWT